MIEVNLLPDSKQAYLKAQQVRVSVTRMSIIVSIVAGVIVVVLALVMAGQAVTGKVIDDAITKKSKQLAAEPDLSKILTIQNQLSLLSSMHTEKSVSSRLFPLLDAINPAPPNDITITGVKLDANEQKMTIDGRAGNMYDAAEAFKKTIVGTKLRYIDSSNKQQTVPLVASAADVVSSGIGVSEDAAGKKVLRLTMTFTYPSALFAESSTNATIESPTESNATDSYLRVPQSLFGQGENTP